MPWNTIIFSFIALVLMALIAGIEMAYYNANRLSLEIKKKYGGNAIKVLYKMIETPAKFLGSTLVGFNLLLVFIGLQISTIMRPVWAYFNIGSDIAHLVLEIALATFIVLIFAEFIPRAHFRARSNSYIGKFTYVADFFYQLFSPIAVTFIKMSEWLLKYFFEITLDKNKQPINRSDLKHLFEQSEDDERHDHNTQLMENAQELPKVKIRQCLVPRKEIIGIDSTATVDELKEKFVETKLSKLVVYENNIDHIIGYVHQLDLFKKPASIKDVLLPIPAIPESMSASDLISKFTRDRKSIAWVVDEFGGTAGIITMEDVLEELFGEIQDEYDTEEFVEKQLSENEYMFSGRLELDYLEEKYGFDFGLEEAETLSGYIINYYETIPRQKERIIIEDYEFDIMHVSDTRIEMVKMKKLK
jgi:putative hemolysin